MFAVSRRLYLGTWQFGGQFKSLTKCQIVQILQFAWDNGIRRFDTAAAYGDGSVEGMLGEVLPADAVILTKVPAISKPAHRESKPPQNFYPNGQIRLSLEGSLRRLKRDYVDTLLLHNWVPGWTEFGPLADEVVGLKDRELIRRIGVSLPDGFCAPLPLAVSKFVDVVEAPWNSTETWITPQISELQEAGVEVVLRSLFLQGRRLFDDKQWSKLREGDIRRSKDDGLRRGLHEERSLILKVALMLQTSLAIGMTTPEQIQSNLRDLQGVHYGQT